MEGKTPKNLYTEGYYYHSVAVDVVIFTIENGELKVLLVTRPRNPFKGSPALPGGVLRVGEKTRDAAIRILREKAGLENVDVYVEQLYTFDDMGRDPRGAMMSVGYFALVPYDKISIVSTPETQDPRFVSVRHAKELAFGHENILSYAMERLRAKIEYSNIVFSLVPKFFTFTELQNVYEIVFGKKLDKRNFRKKVMKLGLIKKTGKTVIRGRQRPAALYKFVSEKPKTFKNSF